MRVFAIRGATAVAANDAESIGAAACELIDALLERNGLSPDDLVSCVFTSTEDLDADFPATAVRGMGLDRVPLLCAREIPVPGSMERVIRVLVHYNAADGHSPQHVYLGEAASLRPDLGSAQ